MAKDKLITLDYREYLDLEECKDIVESIRSKVRTVREDNSFDLRPTIVIELPKEDLMKLIRLQEAPEFNTAIRFRREEYRG